MYVCCESVLCTCVVRACCVRVLWERVVYVCCESMLCTCVVGACCVLCAARRNPAPRRSGT